MVLYGYQPRHKKDSAEQELLWLTEKQVGDSSLHVLRPRAVLLHVFDDGSLCLLANLSNPALLLRVVCAPTNSISSL